MYINLNFRVGFLISDWLWFLLLEGGSQISTDSIFINSSCDSIVRIGAINTNSPNPPKILKTGFNILNLDYVEINHLDAQVVSGESYNLTNSSLHNSTLNWSTTPLAAGTNFYWRQNAQNQSNKVAKDWFWNLKKIRALSFIL